MSSLGRRIFTIDNVETPSPLPPQLAERLKRDERDLIAAVAQQYDSGDVLMLAWMNDEALHRTLTTGVATYYSRSRDRLWVKGETSGNVQHVKSVALDCDGDAVLVKVDQHGPACHTGRRDCFYWRADGEHLVLDKAPLIDPADLYPDKH